MAIMQISAVPRYDTGKRVVKRLRKQGLVPAVVYGKQVENQQIPLLVDAKELRKLLQQITANALVELVVVKENKEKQKITVMLRDIQRDIFVGDLVHVDFFQVNLSKPTVATVAVSLVGDPVGAQEGGVLQHVLREIEVRCLPNEIPEGLEISVSDLGIGDSVHVGQLNIGETIEVLTPLDAVIAAVLAPTMEEEDEEDEDTEDTEGVETEEEIEEEPEDQ